MGIVHVLFQFCRISAGLGTPRIVTLENGAKMEFARYVTYYISYFNNSSQ